jgi:integrase
MGRQHTPWFHRQSGWWVTEIGGKRYRLVQGEPKDARRKTAPREALDRLRRILNECAVNNAESGPGLITVAGLIESYLELGCDANEPRTIENKRQDLQRFVEAYGRTKVTDLLPYHLQKWVKDHPEWRSDDTKAKKVAAVHAAMNWGAKSGLLGKGGVNPLKGFHITGGNERREITASEFRKIWAAARGKQGGRRLREVLMFLKLTGSRPKEARDLTWDAVDTEHDLAVLKDHKTSKKTGEDRVIVLVARVVRLLAAIKARDGNRGRHVFQTEGGTPWHRNSLAQKVRRLRQQHGIDDGATLYTVRHRFGTMAVLRKLNLSASSICGFDPAPGI